MFERLPLKIQRRIYIDDETGCWLWQGATTGKGLYGVIAISSTERVVAHKHIYQLLTGETVLFPENELDHTCEVKHCVNPAHLVVTTKLQNQLASDTLISRNAAKTHCAKGHLLSGDNLHQPSLARGWRVCMQCRNHTPKRKPLRWRT